MPTLLSKEVEGFVNACKNGCPTVVQGYLQGTSVNPAIRSYLSENPSFPTDIFPRIGIITIILEFFPGLIDANYDTLVEKAKKEEYFEFVNLLYLKKHGRLPEQPFSKQEESS